MMMHGFGIPEFFILFVLLMMVVIGVVALAVVFMLRRRQAVPAAAAAASPMVKTDGEDSALTILRERYARGEISKTEYDEMRQALALS